MLDAEKNKMFKDCSNIFSKSITSSLLSLFSISSLKEKLKQKKKQKILDKYNQAYSNIDNHDKLYKILKDINSSCEDIFTSDEKEQIAFLLREIKEKYENDKNIVFLINSIALKLFIEYKI
jgi:uncharacterized protein YerC